MNRTIFNLSDVHIGDKNSLVTPPSYLSPAQREESLVTRQQHSAIIQALESNVRQSDIIVANGDIFDGASYGKKEPQGQPSLQFTINMFERWAQRYPEKTFYFILGNHDGDVGQPEVQAALMQMAAQHPNLHVNEYGVIVGNVLFTHGDLQEYNALDAEKRSWRTLRCHSGDEAAEKTMNLYAFLQEHLQSPHYKNEMQVLVHQEHGAEHEPRTVPLTTKMLKDVHVMFGHTHDYADITLNNGRSVGNSACMKHEPRWQDHMIDAPEKLLQPLLHLEGGKLIEKTRAFPAVKEWTKLAKATRNREARDPFAR
jgi:metallophosphoesterase superfamily enzyme